MKKLTIMIPVQLLDSPFLVKTDHHKYLRQDAIIDYCARRNLKHKSILNLVLVYKQKYYMKSISVSDDSPFIAMNNIERVATYFAGLSMMRDIYGLMDNTFDDDASHWSIDPNAKFANLF